MLQSESSDHKKRGRPRKIDSNDDEVRVILEDQSESEGSSDEGLPFLGMMRGALWT